MHVVLEQSWSIFDDSACLSFLIKGKKVSKRFSLESGVHVVQRVPPTESKGRRHTSRIAVAVLEVPNHQESKSFPESEFRFDAFCGQGPGGQHRNKNMTTVRCTHVPTGITAVSNTKSQHTNKCNAKAAVLAQLHERKKISYHAAVNASRQGQIGSMGRGARIRIYSFIDGFVRDERVKKSFRVKDIMSGKLELIYKCVKKR